MAVAAVLFAAWAKTSAELDGLRAKREVAAARATAAGSALRAELRVREVRAEVAASAALSSALASSPDWADTPIPKEVADALQ